MNGDGSFTEYVDIESGFDPTSIKPEALEEMDCITCHNRITHLVNPPEVTLDQLLEQELISRDIPDIRRQAVEILYRPHETQQEALNAIAGLENYSYNFV